MEQTIDQNIEESHRHPLHRKVGKIFENYFGNNNTEYELFLDEACSDKPIQRIPLFCENDKGNDTEFTNVDILVTKNNQVHIICEIEESNIKPNHIFGKFLSVALSKYWNYKNKLEPIEKNIAFIQILDSKRLAGNSKKYDQWKKIEKSINELISNSKILSICSYEIIEGKLDNLVVLEQKLKDSLAKLKNSIP